MNKKYSTEPGIIYNNLKVVKFLYKTNDNKRKFLFECKCGNFIEAYFDNVARGHTKSCGAAR